MSLRRLQRDELLALAGGALLAVSLFLPWYTTGNRFSTLNGHHGAGLHISAWNALSIMRWFLLAGAASPFILAWITIRGHALSWPRGEMTAVVGIVAITLVLMRGVILRPGSPSGEIGLGVGWYLALVGAVMMFVGAARYRSTQDTSVAKPPGLP